MIFESIKFRLKMGNSGSSGHGSNRRRHSSSRRNSVRSIDRNVENFLNVMFPL